MGGKQSKMKRSDPAPYIKPEYSPGSGSSNPEYPPMVRVNSTNRNPCIPIIDHYPTALESP